MVRYGLFLMLAVLIATHSCKSDRSGSEYTDEESKDTSAFMQLEREIKYVYYRFPSPDEMFRFIDSTGLQFDNTILLPVENANKYLDSRSQAVNLGIYVADLAYITLFQRYKESMDYLQVIYSLSEKIRISAAFDNDLIIRIERNIQNIDSLRIISDKALTDLTNYLVRNDKENTFAIISMGGFIEALYLSLNLVNDYDPENITIRRIIDQKIVLDNLLQYSNEYTNDTHLVTIIKIVNPLAEFFNNIKVLETKTQVTKTKDGRLIIGGGKQFKITKDEFDELKQLVTDIRNKLIQFSHI